MNQNQIPDLFETLKRVLEEALETINATNNIKKFKIIKKFTNLLEKREEKIQEKNQIDEIMKSIEGEELLLFQDEKEKIQKELLEIENTIETQLINVKSHGDGLILEIRAGTGGKEASLFAGDLLKMYEMFCANHKYSIEILHESLNEYGIKSCTLQIKGQGVQCLNLEGGVHRVQRVPATEAKGRIHTSTVTVSILPILEDLNINIEQKDLKIETCRASGAGGQHVNTTDSAIRIVHLPTGISVECQDERSQHENRRRALKELTIRIYQHEQEIRNREIGDKRKSQIGSGERNEKFRTYNYIQNRVTDHRYNITMYNLNNFMNGQMDNMLEQISQAFIESEKQNIINNVLDGSFLNI